MTIVVVWLIAIGYTLIYMGVAGFRGNRPTMGQAMGLAAPTAKAA